MGFLGLLHLEIISERIEREYNIDIIATTPSVNYEINLTDGSTIYIDNPSMMPDKVKIKEIKELSIDNCGERYIILTKKISQTPPKYPRASAQISKKPLS